jgi:hypothetical protein
MAMRYDIRMAAQALCFRACTDCKSADECDPDINWLYQAKTILEAKERNRSRDRTSEHRASPRQSGAPPGYSDS